MAPKQQTFGHSHGRRDTNYQCPYLTQWLRRDDVPAAHYETYAEVMIAIDALIPHIGDRTDTIKHGTPTKQDLEEIKQLEEALLALTGIEANHSALFSYIWQWRDSHDG